MSQFRDTYERLGSDQLIHIALTRELLPEAEATLKAVLASRGILDLSGHRAELQQELSSIEEDRQIKVERRLKAIRWRTRFTVAISLVVLAVGLYFVAYPDKKGSAGDDVMVAIGIGGLLYAFVSDWFSRISTERVLLRRNPTRLRREPGT